MKSGNLTLIRNATGELPHVDLTDALAVCVAALGEFSRQFGRLGAGSPVVEL